MDLLGIVLISVAIFALVWALVEAPSIGWAHPVTLVSLGAAVLFGIAFVLWERKPEQPLIPLGLFAHPSVSIGVVLTVAMAVGLMGSLFFITFYLQGVRGMSPAQTGLQLIAMKPVFVYLTFSRYPQYATYELAPRISNISARADQQMAGLLMEVAGMIIILMAVGVMQFQLRRRQKLFSLTEPTTPLIVGLYVLGLYFVFQAG
jgi:hypothetical protein